ncbi:heptaprenyl diphosphate synthase component 1 [Virgibacillus necropolis]|uniref:heptaprenyl diphosphate synthase component 1 n=1 Tax=Virgibacillus necropolis TaxID=163877 RepID=UPI003850BEF0
MPTSSVEINKLRSLIEEKIQHVYVDKTIQKPAIDDIKLALLYTIMKQSNLPQPKIEQYILSTIFVQMALDTHEIVPIKNNKNESSSEQRKRQLKVLAGDYYSGLFYSLLSDTEDFEVIHILAAAIREINEYKMSFFYNQLNSVEEAIDLLMKIESLLISRMLNQVQVITDPALIENIIILNILLREKHLFISNESSPVFENLLIFSGNERDLRDKLDQIIEGKIKSIEEYITRIPIQYVTLKNDVTRILGDMLENNTSIAKEG